MIRSSLAASTGLLGIWIDARTHCDRTAGRGFDQFRRLLQGFTRDNPVDVWKNVRGTFLAMNAWDAPARVVWKAPSTFEASRADVSMNERLFSAVEGRNGQICGEEEQLHIPAKAFASSVGTARRCFKSLLFPTNIMMMLASAWSLSSFSHRVTLTYVECLAISYTSSAPTAPR